MHGNLRSGGRINIERAISSNTMFPIKDSVPFSVISFPLFVDVLSEKLINRDRSVYPGKDSIGR